VVFFSDNDPAVTQVGQALNSNPALSTSILGSDPYVGGYTNTASGFRLCNAQLDTGNNTKRILVMLTDGNPTACNVADNTAGCGCQSGINDACATGSALTAANSAAAAARADGYEVIPVGVGAGISTANLANWGTNNTFLTVGDFGNLASIIGDLLEAALCV
jgi:nitric oxide reductase activation protein